MRLSVSTPASRGGKELLRAAVELEAVLVADEAEFLDDGLRHLAEVQDRLLAACRSLVRPGGRVGRLEGDEDLFAPGTLVAGNPEIYTRLRTLLATTTPP